MLSLLPASTHSPKGLATVVLSGLSAAAFFSWRVVSPYLLRQRPTNQSADRANTRCLKEKTMPKKGASGSYVFAKVSFECCTKPVYPGTWLSRFGIAAVPPVSRGNPLSCGILLLGTRPEMSPLYHTFFFDFS